MKKQLLLPITALVGGVVAAILRLLQNRTGFEPDTGLPIPGNLPGTALVVLLAALAVVLVVLVRQLSQARTPVFPRDFATSDTRMLLLPMAGVFLMGVSGILDLLSGLGLTELSSQGMLPAASAAGMVFSGSDGYSSQAHLLLGVLDLLSAGGLFFGIRACSCKRRPDHFQGTWLLVPVIAMAVRLVLAYRADSINPALEAYYVELLALVFLNLAFYRLSSYAFGCGRTRSFTLYTCCAVVLCMASISDHRSLSALTWELGAGAVVLGCLLLCFTARPSAQPPEAESV